MSWREALSSKWRELTLSALLVTGAGGITYMSAEDAMALTDQQKQSLNTLKDANDDKNKKAIDPWVRAKALADIIKSPRVDSKRLLPQIVKLRENGKPFTYDDVKDVNYVAMNAGKVLVNVVMMVPEGVMKDFDRSVYEKKLNTLRNELYSEILRNKENTGFHVDAIYIAEHKRGQMLVDTPKIKEPAKDAISLIIGTNEGTNNYRIKDFIKHVGIISEEGFHYTSDDIRYKEKTAGSNDISESEVTL